MPSSVSRSGSDAYRMLKRLHPDSWKKTALLKWPLVGVSVSFVSAGLYGFLKKYAYLSTLSAISPVQRAFVAATGGVALVGVPERATSAYVQSETARIEKGLAKESSKQSKSSAGERRRRLEELQGKINQTLQELEKARSEACHGHKKTISSLKQELRLAQTQMKVEKEKSEVLQGAVKLHTSASQSSAGKKFKRAARGLENGLLNNTIQIRYFEETLSCVESEERLEEALCELEELRQDSAIPVQTFVTPKKSTITPLTKWLREHDAIAPEITAEVRNQPKARRALHFSPGGGSTILKAKKVAKGLGFPEAHSPDATTRTPVKTPGEKAKEAAWEAEFGKTPSPVPVRTEVESYRGVGGVMGGASVATLPGPDSSQPTEGKSVGAAVFSALRGRSFSPYKRAQGDASPPKSPGGEIDLQNFEAVRKPREKAPKAVKQLYEEMRQAHGTRLETIKQLEARGIDLKDEYLEAEDLVRESKGEEDLEEVDAKAILALVRFMMDPLDAYRELRRAAAATRKAAAASSSSLRAPRRSKKVKVSRTPPFLKGKGSASQPQGGK